MNTKHSQQSKQKNNHKNSSINQNTYQDHNQRVKTSFPLQAETVLLLQHLREWSVFEQEHTQDNASEITTKYDRFSRNSLNYKGLPWFVYILINLREL